MNTYARFPLAPIRGEGCYFWDADGNKYLDFLSGIAVSALGHCHPALVRALREQAEAIWHTSNLYWIPQQLALAEKLTRLSGLGKAFFCNSGTEANEAAIKLARKYFYRRGEKRYEIIVFNQSFHGRTLGALSATAQPKYQEGFAPLAGGFVQADFNDPVSAEKLIGEHTAAIMLEPIQGEGGVFPAQAAFIQRMKRLAEENGLLLIFDEVQCGVGRSGTFFAYEQLGARPDIVTMAKALAGGFPIGAALASDEAASGFMPGDHAATFGGNPLAAAVGNALVEIVSAPDFLASVRENGRALREGLLALRDERIVAVRGLGLMLGVEFDREVRPLVDSLLREGLVAGLAGANVLRLVPPLIAGPAEVGAALSFIARGLKQWR
jgi:predicted acetylornithine/succinylornithine family transaminase